MEILLFAGSLRKDSLNKKLVAVAQRMAAAQPDCKTTVVDLQPLQFPVYDGDIESKGIPDSVKKFGEMISRADALIISSPEYNGSLAGSFKNVVDWVSRLKPVPWEKKPILMLGASPGMFGATGALGAAHAMWSRLKAFEYPQIFPLPKAHEAFAENGDLKDEALKKQLGDLVAAYVQYVKKLKA